ncbi:YonK family protein [Clostridium botulinum]|uniref:YonK family protein n=1 Tax=Clostridium botulinum TaxID=1491 RepID=UPI0004D42E2C|nr:YonK family protein [Clostridium botulinum]KEH99866.1 hypothetical protein Z952_p0198 [Clostridium botulinum C/D str. BKT75002]KEI05345.1 hypothetical protein Z954_0199 [Clostridium botulinum C/D str. BKT2873]QPW62032.1 YonK family protein [Clostridium botulinum]
MAKENKSVTFTKATITKEDGAYKITEYHKDNVQEFNLSKKLDEYLDIENLSLTIKKDEEITGEAV